MESAEEIDFCLLIPCYNNYSGLIKSLKSVIYRKDSFLILIVDDGSNEIVNREEISKEIGTDKPVAVLRNEKNLGITRALNNGLAWIEKNCSPKYIARLDCGDICLPERFELQVDYLNANPATGLVGSWAKMVDEETGHSYIYKAPVKSNEIQRSMYYKNIFMHATVMFKTSLARKVGYYPNNFEYAEDYALFWRLIKIENAFVINRYLVICQLNRTGISFKNKSRQLIARWRVVNKLAPSNFFLKVAGFMRLLLLFISPKRITLFFKRWKS